MKQEMIARLGSKLREIRENAGVSQETASRICHVSKTQIQKWENGDGTPSLQKAFDLCEELNENLIPYLYEAFFPREFEHTKNDMTDEELERALFVVIHDLPTEYKRKLLFMLHENYGGSTLGLLDRATLYKQLPLRDRVSSTFSLHASYKTAEALNMLQFPDAPKPNLKLLEMSMMAGMESVLHGEDKYTLSKYMGDQQ